MLSSRPAASNSSEIVVGVTVRVFLGHTCPWDSSTRKAVLSHATVPLYRYFALQQSCLMALHALSPVWLWDSKSVTK